MQRECQIGNVLKGNFRFQQTLREITVMQAHYVKWWLFFVDKMFLYINMNDANSKVLITLYVWVTN